MASSNLTGLGLPVGRLLSSSQISMTEKIMDLQPDVVAIALFASLLCFCIIVGHLLEEHRWINESVTAILFGLVAGTVVLIFSQGASSHILEFNEGLFFIYLLPPIIFNAGFQVKKKQFFRNILCIMAYGVVGVFISCGIISSGCMLFFKFLGFESLETRDYFALGTIFSATDSVCTLQVLSQDEQPLLYSLVFGEGVVNDAASIVLFRAVQKLQADTPFTMASFANILSSFVYLFVASTALGVAVGLLSAFIIRQLYIGWHSTDREIALMILMAYLSYLVSELAELSGILTVFFCGIVMSHYTWHNVTESSRVTTKHGFATMSFIAETFIFLYVGMDTMSVSKWQNTRASQFAPLFATLLFLTLLGRAAFVFPLSALLNIRRRAKSGAAGGCGRRQLQSRSGGPISLRQQVVVWWSGLMRGAVSIALTFSAFPDTGARSGDSTIMSTTVALVLFSTVFFGLLTRPLIDNLLPIPPDHDDSFHSDTDSHVAGLLDPLLEAQAAEEEDEEEGQGKGLTELAEQQVSVVSLAKAPSKLRALLTAREKDIHDLWRSFDDKFMRPHFGGRGFVPYVPASPTVQDLPLSAAARWSPVLGGEDDLPSPAVTPLASIEELPERPSKPAFHAARSVDQGLAESDPAWPQTDDHHRRERRRRLSLSAGKHENGWDASPDH